LWQKVRDYFGLRRGEKFTRPFLAGVSGEKFTRPFLAGVSPPVHREASWKQEAFFVAKGPGLLWIKERREVYPPFFGGSLSACT